MTVDVVQALYRRTTAATRGFSGGSSDPISAGTSTSRRICECHLWVSRFGLSQLMNSSRDVQSSGRFELLREQLVYLEERIHVIDHYLEDDTLVLKEETK